LYNNAILSKLSNLELWSVRGPIGSHTWAFQTTHSWTLKIQDGGHPPSWESWNRNIWTKNHPILMKFDTQQHIWNSMTVTWIDMKIFENSTWRTAAILKIVFGHNSVAGCPISVKCYVGKQLFFSELNRTDTRVKQNVFLVILNFSLILM